MKVSREGGLRESGLEPTLHLLASRWADAGILLPAFAVLARGRPLEIDEIARASGATVERVARALDAGRCERDETGRLIDLYGLTLTPTLHRLTIDGKTLFACCALWAHVIPKLVDRTVQIESIDPIRREPVRLLVSPRGVETADSPQPMATLTVATQAAIDADVNRAFCRRVCHFVTRDSAQELAADRPGCQVVDLSELQQAAGLLHQAIWRTVEA